MKKKVKIQTTILLLIAILILLLCLILSNKPNPKISENEKNYCSEKSRGADACISVYSPVCGWSNSEKKEKTFSNSCFACTNNEILFWTSGEC